MKRPLIPLAIAFAITAGGLFAALGQPRSSAATEPQTVPSMAPGDLEEKQLTVQRITRAGTKVVTVTHDSSDAVRLYSFTAEDEMDLTALTINNGLFGSLAANDGGATLWLMETPSGPIVNYFFAFEGYGAFHFTFPTPIPVRQGDNISITIPGGNAPPQTGFTQVHLVGEPPVRSDRLAIY